MEACDGSISKLLKAKFRASNSELLKDFSALLNSKLNNLNQIEPPQSVIGLKTETRRRRIRPQKSVLGELDGVLGLASFILEGESAALTLRSNIEIACLKPVEMESPEEPHSLSPLESAAIESRLKAFDLTEKPALGLEIIGPSSLSNFHTRPLISTSHELGSNTKKPIERQSKLVSHVAISQFIIDHRRSIAKSELVKKRKVEEDWDRNYYPRE